MRLYFVANIFLLILSPNYSQAVDRANFGESCNTTLRCSSQSWLTCRDEVCDCIQPETMRYREDKNKCVGKAGERCKFEIEGTNFVESTDCVENAECSTEGICVCNSGFYEDREQNCSKERSYNETCDAIDKCATSSGLSCTEGKCTCNSNITEYSSTKRKCVGLIGEKCVDEKCVDFGYCSDTLKCICPEYTFAEKDDSGYTTCTPKKSHGAPCLANNECKTNSLACVKGHCDCNPHHEKIYHPSLHLCAPIVGSDCSENQICTQHAVCEKKFKQNHNEYYSYQYRHRQNERQCVCPSPRFKTGSDGSCKIKYEESCSENDLCADDLKCVNSKCKCQFSALQRYDGNRCLSQVEAPCVNNSTCDANSYCEFFKNSLMGFCKCKEGFVEASNRKCKAKYGSPCTKGEDCDDLVGLKCYEGKCGCPGFSNQKYNETSRSCVGLVGAICGDKENKQWGCTENAECVPYVLQALDGKVPLYRVLLGLEKRCQCKKGYVPGENYECVSGDGENLMSKLVSMLPSNPSWNELPQADQV